MTDIIVYPAGVATGKEKLTKAVYPLLEQMRLEHNRQHDIYAASPEKYRKKWLTYIKRFREKQRPLLREQNHLRDTIRRAVYTDKEWLSLNSPNPDDALFVSLFGNRAAERVEPTLATSPLLDELKAIELDKLGDTPGIDPYEDFENDYTEDDDAGSYSVSGNVITITDQEGSDDADYVYKDHGADHFGDFEHLVEINLVSSDTDMYLYFWALQNAVSDYPANPGLYVFMRGRPSSAAYVYLREYQSTYDNWTSAAQNTLYYCTVARSDTDITCEIRTGSHGGALQDTLSLTGDAPGTTSYRYLYGVQSAGFLGGSIFASGVSRNFDLQEMVAYEESASVSVGCLVSASRAIAIDRDGSVIIGNFVSAARSWNVPVSASVIVGNLVTAARSWGVTKSASVIIGDLVTASRAITATRSASVLIGNLVSASRSWNVTASASVIIGNLVSATRVFGTTRSASVMVGILVAASRSWGVVVSSSVIVGVLAIASRLVAIARSASVIVGVLASASRSWGVIVSSSVIVGALVSASRSMAISRSASVVTGILVSSSRIGAITRSATTSVGVLVTASVVAAITRSASVMIGVLVSASRALVNTRTSSVIVGILVSASALVGYTRSAAVSIGVLVTASAVHVVSHIKSAAVVIGVKVTASYCTFLRQLLRVTTSSLDTARMGIARMTTHRLPAARKELSRRIRECF